MIDAIRLPLWLVVIGGVLAAWALLDHLLLPSVRWFLRRRDKVVIKEIDEHLNLHLPPFKLIKKRVLIGRLMSDPKVLDAVEEYCQKHGISTEAGLKKAEHYAKEIVPSFHAYIYFRIGYRISKSVARLLYRVRIGYADEKNLAKIDPLASAVFLMNHRSNVDYILLGYFALSRAVLSFAVGEWARVWGLEQLLRAMGAYFVRRGSGNPLYRCVLARYVQMATEGGVVQAVFLEGRLSRDGKLREPKIGLLDYMLRDFDPERERDIVFIPAGVNYDRVLEDRTVLLDTGPGAGKKPRKNAVMTATAFIFRNIWQMVRGRWFRFGYAAVNFGRPVSMREYVKTHNIDFHTLDKEARIDKVKNLASELLHEVGKVIPVLPVSLIAYVFAESPDKAFSDLELKARVQRLIKDLEAQGAHVYIPRQDRDYAITVGLRMLTLRHLILEENNLYRASADDIEVLHYYANSIAHFVPLGEPSNKSLSSS